MVVDDMYPWLERYMEKESTSLYVLQKIEFKLSAIGATFQEDCWSNVLDYIDIRQDGWEKVKAEWKRVRSGTLHQSFLSIDVFIPSASTISPR